MGPFYGKSKSGEYMHSMGLVNAVLTNPKNENELIISTNSSGIWRSNNRGVIWNCVTDREDFLPGMGIKSFSVNPSSPNEIIAGGGNYCYGDNNYGGLVLFSKDRGKTWEKSESFSKKFEGKLVTKVVYFSSKIIYVLTNESLFKSENSGQDWKKIFEINIAQEYIDSKDQRLIDFEYFENGNLFVSSTHSWGAKGNLFKSTDEGKSWKNLLKTKEFNNLFDKHILFVTLTKPVGNKMFVGLGSGGDVSLYKTTNQGENFIKSGTISTKNPSIDAKAGKFEMEMSLEDSDRLYIGSIDLFEWDSINKLKRLSPRNNISEDEHDDVRFLEIKKIKGKETLVMGNDGGVSFYDTESKKFEGLNGFNLPTLQVYNLAISQFDSNFMMYIGTQDNGTHEYLNNDWHFISGGDGGGNVLDDRGFLKINSINSAVMTYRGKARRYFSPTKRFSAWFIDFPIEISKSDSAVLFGSRKRGSAEGGSLFIQDLDEKNHEGIVVPQLNNIGEIAISNTDPNLIFLAEGEHCNGNGGCNKLVKTTDRGKSFTNLSEALVFPNSNSTFKGRKDTIALRKLLGYRKVTDIEIDPYDNEIIFVSLNGNFKEESWSKNWEYYRVLKSEDGGESWMDYSQGLPTTPIFCLLRDERDENILFCGGDEGLYKCDNYYGIWKTWSNGLPKNVPITDIKLNYCQDKLYCSTYGRGVYGVYSSTALDYQEITKDETWDSYRFVKRDIEILRGKTLTISADLAMAPSTTVTLHPKSTLIIDGATITSNCTDKWWGISIKEKRFLWFFKRKKGKVVYKNGGKTKNSKVKSLQG
ncbi:MAG: hypothetical protein ABF242_02115 [Flavobacteriales bacterium]